MRTLLKTTLAVLLCAAASMSAKAQGVVVYQNTDTYIRPFVAPNATEIGDQVILGGTERAITGFSFEYWGQNFTTATADIRFYRNDGPMVNGAATPGTLIYDTGSFQIDATSGKVLSFDQAALDGGFIVPTTFTWTMTITSNGGEAGPQLYGPPTTGDNFSDMWYNNNGTWELRSGDVPLDFNAKFTATVPEPTTIALLGLGGLVGAAFMRRNRK